MIFTPHIYQEYAKDWIIKKPFSGLFLDLGMGKTVCTLSAVQELMHDYFDVVKVLVIAPLRVARDTVEEVLSVLQNKERHQEDLHYAVKARLKKDHSWMQRGEVEQ